MAKSAKKKSPLYSSREMDVLRHADRVVARLVTGRELTFFPKEGERVVDVLSRVILARKMLDSIGKRIMVYIGGEVDGEVRLVSIDPNL
jgi:hypothetical protein